MSAQEFSIPLSSLPEASALAEAIAQRCAKAKSTGTGWQACCPAHEDDTPSLSITQATDKVLLHCHAGCASEAIVAALGLRMADLFLRTETHRGKRIIATYDYHDAHGTLVHQTVRFEPTGTGKDFKQRRPDPTRLDAWIWKLQGIETVLYHLPHVLSAIQRGELVYVVEGEKDADALMALGLTATCNPMGAGKWKKSYSETLRGARVVMLPDHDAPGAQHTENVARYLHGIAAEVTVVGDVHTDAPGSDVSDWLHAGHTRAELEALVEQAPAYLPPATMSVGGQSVPADHNGTTPATSGLAVASGTPAVPYSDYTNALALVRTHGTELRYCHPWGKWLVWTGTHWDMEATGQVMRWGKETILALLDRVQDLPTMSQQHALLAHVKASLSTAKLKAMVENAESELPLPVLPEALDRDPWLLNVANGTLDLHTGTLKPHDRGDLLTRCLSVPYNPDAVCPIWDAFLTRIMADNTNLLSFLQRAVGYALTGVIREHVLPILWGSGRNGKSTFLNTLRTLLGAYAIKASAELLMVSNNDRHPTERADLFQKRFVAVIETEKGRRMAEVFVKEATGGDPIRARRMREDMWEFQPTHKLFLATNHKPTIKGTDDAIWERMKLVKFGVTITKPDTALPDKLQAELPGILAWAVRGCLAWQHKGLGEPHEVTSETGGYRDEMDVIGRFLKEECARGTNSVTGTAYTVAASLLHKSYQQWSGDTSISPYAFKQALAEKGYEQKRAETGMSWQGIGLPATFVVKENRKDLA